MSLFSLSRELDTELRQILDDVNEFSLADVGSSSETMFSTPTNNNNSIYSDTGFVEEHLEECVIQFCTKYRKIADRFSIRLNEIDLDY